jgi:hypothetical protein
MERNKEGRDITRFKSDEDNDYDPYFGTLRKIKPRKIKLMIPTEKL